MPDIAYIKAQKRADKRLIHASNILSKNNTYSAPSPKRTILLSIAQRYHAYLQSNLALTGYSEQVIRQRVELLNDYYNYIHDCGWDNAFDSRGKFRSTILEEFIYILFKDLVHDLTAALPPASAQKIGSGSVKAYLNLFISARNFVDFASSPNISKNEKNQDFAIYRQIDMSVGATSLKMNIPCVAIEAKTYIDKTMLDTVIATAEKLKEGNPYTKFIAVSETYAVAMEVDPAYSRIDSIYVLRKTATSSGVWNQIDANLVVELFNEVHSHIISPWSDVATKLAQGKIISR